MKTNIQKQISDWAVWSFAFLIFTIASVVGPRFSTKTSPDPESQRIIYSIYSGKLLIVIVVKDAVQIGENLYSIENALDQIPKIIQENGVRNYCVFASDDAKWGDVVSIYGIANISNASRRQLSARSVSEFTKLPEFISLKKNNRIWCGFSLQLDSFVQLGIENFDLP